MLDRLGPRIERTLADVEQAARRFNQSGEELEKGLKLGTRLLKNLGEVSGSLRVAASLGSALGPAVGAAVKAFLERDGRPDDAPADGGPAPEEIKHPRFDTRKGEQA